VRAHARPGEDDRHAHDLVEERLPALPPVVLVELLPRGADDGDERALEQPARAQAVEEPADRAVDAADLGVVERADLVASASAEPGRLSRRRSDSTSESGGPPGGRRASASSEGVQGSRARSAKWSVRNQRNWLASTSQSSARSTSTSAGSASLSCVS
jgi:hypothetical protein